MKSVSLFVVSLLVVLSVAPPSAKALTLGEAVDAPELFWATGLNDDSLWQDASWGVQTNDTFDGIDAAVAGGAESNDPYTPFPPSSINTTLVGGGELSFQWKLSMPLDGGWVTQPSFLLFVNGKQEAALLARNAWISETLILPAGIHCIEWRVNNGYHISNGSDSCFLDQVNWTGESYRPRIKNDFDGDGVSDIGVYHGATGKWYLQKSKDGFEVIEFGFAATVPVTGDYDGDLKTDLALYCANDGSWYFLCTKDGFKTAEFGFSGTIPFNADFDGD